MSQETKDIGYKNTIEQVSALIKAKVPIIWVVTHEEARFISDLYENLVEKDPKRNRGIFTWSSFTGVNKYVPDSKQSKEAPGPANGWDKTAHPGIALTKIAEHDSNGSSQNIYVLKDFHTVLHQGIPRQLRDMYQYLIDKEKTIIITAPGVSHGAAGAKPGMEPTLDKQILVVEYELPTYKAIEENIRGHIADISESQADKASVQYTDEQYAEFTRAVQGLTMSEIENAVFTSVAHLKRLDYRHLLQEKKQIVKKSDILEYIDQMPAIDEVGGLDEAKKFFGLYDKQFSQEAKDFGVEPLKGVLLTGVPGTGKSLLAKAIAAMWKLPLLRLDVGKVMTGLVGGSEQKMRQVITQAEAIAPCVLWIDEIEKSLSGTKSSNFSDGGTLARVFGTLLTAMEERFQNIVVVATANDIESLPPELIRRFNEVFFVDLPVAQEREEILNIHLKKRDRDAKKLKLDMKKLVNDSYRFTGSEIEKSVKEGIARAFYEKQADLSTEHISGAMKDTKAIAKIMKDKIDAIRNWAKNKARYASSLAAAESEPGKQKVTTSTGSEMSVDEVGDLDDLQAPTQTVKKTKGRADDLL